MGETKFIDPVTISATLVSDFHNLTASIVYNPNSFPLSPLSQDFDTKSKVSFQVLVHLQQVGFNFYFSNFLALILHEPGYIRFLWGRMIHLTVSWVVLAKTASALVQGRCILEMQERDL